MDLISSAQNNEDVMLWRALKGVEDGFYVDVGAADPDELSVTRLFYDHGWRGLNVEPDPGLHARLCRARPRDANVRAVVGAAPGVATFHQVVGTGLSTVDPDLAERHRAAGWAVVAQSAARRTLAELCEEHRPAGDIHFLKIDVEGAEADVLRGADFGRFRPWIVVCEATAPTSQRPDHERWEPLLLERGYEFAWFDGLNRFYLAQERAALAPHFRVQPNVFDGFVRVIELPAARLAAAQREAEAEAEGRRRAENALAAVHSAIATLQSHAEAERADRTAAERQAREATAARAEADRGAAMARALLTRWSEDARTAAAAAHAALAQAQDEARQWQRTAAERDAAWQAERAHVALLLSRLAFIQERLDAEANRRAAGEQGRDAAEQWAAALRASRSWRITAPIRGVASGLQRQKLRARRLAHVASLGAGAALSARGPARVALYVMGRAALRAPGGRFAIGAVRRAAPGPHSWLARRYALYRTAADQAFMPSPPPAPVADAAVADAAVADAALADSALADSALADSVAVAALVDPVLAIAEAPAPLPDISAEEAGMLRLLLDRSAAA